MRFIQAMARVPARVTRRMPVVLIVVVMDLAVTMLRMRMTMLKVLAPVIATM